MPSFSRRPARNSKVATSSDAELDRPRPTGTFEIINALKFGSLSFTDLIRKKM